MPQTLGCQGNFRPTAVQRVVQFDLGCHHRLHQPVDAGQRIKRCAFQARQRRQGQAARLARPHQHRALGVNDGGSAHVGLLQRATGQALQAGNVA